MLLDGVFDVTEDELESGTVSNWTLNFHTEQLCTKCVIKAMLLDGVFGATGDELESGSEWLNSKLSYWTIIREMSD